MPGGSAWTWSCEFSPPATEDQRDRRDDDDHDGEDYRHGGGEVGLVGGDRGVVHVHGRGVVERDRSLLEVLEDLRLGEQLQRADGVEEDQHHDGGPHHRELDPHDDLPWVWLFSSEGLAGAGPAGW